MQASDENELRRGPSIPDMGLFFTTCGVENPLRRGVIHQLDQVLVDSGAELSWIPAHVLEALGIEREKRAERFVSASGQVLVREIGFAIVHAGGNHTIDEVAFGEPGDLVLLGARTIEGLNLKVDLPNKRFVAGGPILAAPARAA
jgi:predicted aspartyl protease